MNRSKILLHAETKVQTERALYRARNKKWIQLFISPDSIENEFIVKLYFI